MSSLLFIHQISAVLSIAAYFFRGLGHLFNKPWANAKLLRIAPHVIYTTLLVSAIALVVMMELPFTEGWIIAKILGLIAFIVFGVLMMKDKFSRKQQAIFWLLGLITLFYVIMVAKTKLVMPI